MRFYGLLFGIADRADALFSAVDSSYNALRLLAAKAGKGRSVIIDKVGLRVVHCPEDTAP